MAYLTPWNRVEEEKAKKKRRAIVVVSVASLSIVVVLGGVALQTARKKAEINDLKLVSYEGAGKFSPRSGEGTLKFLSGASYQGAWNERLLQGPGELALPEGGTFDGVFLDSKKEGQGKFIWPNGDVYDGGWRDDRLEGSGRYTTSEGGVFDGEFRQNQFWSGTYREPKRGVVKFKDGKAVDLQYAFADGSRYSGELANGKLHGRGTLTYANADVYVGEYSKGLRDGVGKYSWFRVGDVYEGEWRQDKMCGVGVYVWASGARAEGTFYENKFVDGEYSPPLQAQADAKTTYSIAVKNGKCVRVTISCADGFQYDGESAEGKITGRGKAKYPAGDVYNGEFLDGKRCGEGTYEWRSGATYKGEWENDQANGSGVYKFPDASRRISGRFKNGRPDGICEFSESGVSYKTYWQDGQCDGVEEPKR